jgi:hypothetical protein
MPYPRDFTLLVFIDTRCEVDSMQIVCYYNIVIRTPSSSGVCLLDRTAISSSLIVCPSLESRVNPVPVYCNGDKGDDRGYYIGRSLLLLYLVVVVAAAAAAAAH